MGGDDKPPPPRPIPPTTPIPPPLPSRALLLLMLCFSESWVNSKKVITYYTCHTIIYLKAKLTQSEHKIEFPWSFGDVVDHFRYRYWCVCALIEEPSR